MLVLWVPAVLKVEMVLLPPSSIDPVLHANDVARASRMPAQHDRADLAGRTDGEAGRIGATVTEHPGIVESPHRPAREHFGAS
jgi:hypothetical protein